MGTQKSHKQCASFPFFPKLHEESRVAKVEENLMEKEYILFFISILADNRSNKAHPTVSWNLWSSWIANIRQIISYFYDKFFKGKAQYEINTKQKCEIW